MRHSLAAMAAPNALPWLLALSLATLLRPSCGNFVSSLHSQFVVNLDFDREVKSGMQEKGESASGSGGETRVMAFAGGRQRFKCSLPSTSGRHKPQTGSQEASDVTKFKTHFMNAKMAPFMNKCWTTKKDYWSYDVCFGRNILQYHSSDTRFSLGEIIPYSTELHPDGHVSEEYIGGTDNRSTTVNYVCGYGGEQRSFAIEEPKPLTYIVTVSSPVFCSWRNEKDGETVAEDASGNRHPVSSLLEDLRGHCVNVTQGWWTYEYCYPHSLIQFHQGGSGRDPEHILGTVNSTDQATTDRRNAVGQVQMKMVRLKPSISARERRAPPSNHRTLQQFLGSGTVCDETGRPRTTTMHFQCPPNWQTQQDTRIVSINEAQLCEYEIMVHTNLLCGHQKLIPALPKGKDVIQCTAEPQ